MNHLECRVGPQSNDWYPYPWEKKQHRETHTGKRRSHVNMEAETEVTLPQLRDAMNHKKLEEARKDSPLSFSESMALRTF